MTQTFGIPKTMVMIQTKDGRYINLGECNIKSEPIVSKEEPDYERPTGSISFSATIEPTGDLMKLFGGTPRGKTYDNRKRKPTKTDLQFRSLDYHRCPRKIKKRLKKDNRRLGNWKYWWNINRKY